MSRNAIALAAAALLTAFAIPVQAQSTSNTPEARALEAAKKGPQALRSFIHRTRMIYALSFNDFYPPKE